MTPGAELTDFRQWVHSLSHDALLRAMEFELSDDEYKILKDMIAQQAPPPTPVHPGILGYRPATRLGATDGRNEEERIYKARFDRPRLFQLHEIPTASRVTRKTRSNRRRAVLQTNKRCDVCARKFVTAWGQVLSIGCTQEQREMDELMLKGTRIHHAAIQKGNVQCMFCCTSSSLNIIRVLHVASRGKFLSLRPSSSSSSTSSTLAAFCAPWLHADVEWFSLPMFLASRFELALWTSFRQVRADQSSDFLSSWSRPIQDAIGTLNAGVFRCALLSATVKTLQKDILPKDGMMSLIRDAVIWNMLDSSSCRKDCSLVTSDTLTNVGSVVIVYLGSSLHTFQMALWNQLEEAVAVESQKQILRSLENETETSTVAAATPRRKKAKAKKKRRSKAPSYSKSEPSAVQNRNTVSTTKTETKVNVRMPLTNPKEIATAKENTRKMIIAGLIIEEVLEGVFFRLGLNEPPSDKQIDNDSSDCVVNSNTEQILSGQHDKTEVQSTQPVVKNSESFAKEEPEASFTEQIHIDDNVAFPKLPAPSGPIDEIAPFDEPLPVVQDEGFPLESEFFSVPWMFDDTVDHWDKLKRYPNRERSLLADLFLSQKKDIDDDAKMASSTAASIASSSDKGNESAEQDSVEADEKEDLGVGVRSDPPSLIAPVLEEAVLEAVAASINDGTANDSCLELETLTVSDKSHCEFIQKDNLKEDDDVEQNKAQGGRNDEKDIVADCRSPSPDVPQTPPPQLSPILVSLADLQTIRTHAATETAESPKAQSFSAVSAGSLPSSPMPASAALTQSWSREDLRIHSFADDQRLPNRNKGFTLKKRTSAPLSYRAVAAKTLPKPKFTSVTDGRSSFIEVAAKELRSSTPSATSIPDIRPSVSSKNECDACAQSETAVEVHSYEVPLNDAPRNAARDNTEVSISTKDDGLMSPPRANVTTEEIAALRDERNAFCDMCLTLGAEVSKLKNLLAAQNGGSSSYGPACATKSPCDPALYQPYSFQGVPKATTTVGAMSDAGTHRGDHDSAFSEDGTDGIGHDNSGRPRAVHVRRMSSNATNACSDLSVEQNVIGQAMIGASSFRSLSRDVVGFISGNEMQSRLTTDIMNFLKAKSAALRIQDRKKTMAIERLTRLVTAIWPRAQVKIYGSHVTGLCLPSSDLDFVICLPAVHKNAPAVAPGALEGRNAINESSQKTLARMLKGESWIDPRSIKIIERTLIPVIKVSTKDTRARMIQLDISFDGPEHHGLAANQMITDVLRELPMIQPLVLVLKQFLKDRGLLTAYTGGLSSYGLFLMVTRYLQEHSSPWDDCGSLLIGFLDFYGNSFDPRATGIGQYQYFARLNYPHPQQMWDVGFQQHLTSTATSSAGGRPDLIQRRNSFNENATMDGLRVSVSPAVSIATAPHVPRPPRYQQSHHRFPNQQYQHPAEQSAQTVTAYDQSSKPYTFDPIFIEDPLSQGNNVGRNAFRVFQVQRAFSDAHRALVASLEWDIHSSQHDLHDGEYPLLNCLLQSEDVFYELDE